MNRMIIAAAALIAAPVLAPAQDAGETEAGEQMTMLQQRLGEALEGCNIEMDEAGMMDLTMAQVSGIVLSANSADGADVCQEVESIALGDM